MIIALKSVNSAIALLLLHRSPQASQIVSLRGLIMVNTYGHT